MKEVGKSVLDTYIRMQRSHYQNLSLNNGKT